MTKIKCNCGSENVTSRKNTGKNKKYKFTHNCNDCGLRFNTMRITKLKKRLPLMFRFKYFKGVW